MQPDRTAKASSAVPTALCVTGTIMVVLAIVTLTSGAARPIAVALFALASADFVLALVMQRRGRAPGQRVTPTGH